MADIILSEEEKVEIENRFEEHVGQMIRLGSSFGREVPESAKSADLIAYTLQSGSLDFRVAKGEDGQPWR